MAAVHSLKVSVIGARTNSSGVAQTDWDQEEMRMMAMALMRQGRLPNMTTGANNPDAFKVRQGTGSDMNVTIGSGTTKVDGYLLRGTASGQGAYVVRLDATGVTKSVPAADATLLTAYGVYLYVNDENYSGSAGAHYAELSVLAGTPHASAPVVPSASVSWAASALLWSFRLPAAATAVTNTILDNSTAVDARTTSSTLGVNHLEFAVFA